MKSRGSNQRTPSNPWGRALGLLMAALVTLLGVATGMEPIVVLKRSFVAAIVVGLTVSVAIQVLQVLATNAPRGSR